MFNLKDIQSVTEFQRNVKSYVGRLKKQRRPLVLTVNGRAELVVQDAASYQALLARLDRIDTIDALKQGLDEFAKGKGIPAGEALRKLQRKHGMAR